MKRSHNMPFGAECRDDGSVRFRLWAPAARQVELSLAGGHRASECRCLQIPLSKGDDGWFELVTDAAAAGSQYRFRIDERQEVPDPASRFQPQDVHGPSQVISPIEFEWNDGAWRGRRWEEAIIYELHVGAFTPAGTFAGASEKLRYIADLGVTAIELMPLGDFPGRRNWGYDGVLPFAPDNTYGGPDDLKTFIQAAHNLGIMVFLDVVYNHFGPEGNYLGLYAPQFFTSRHCTPWGDAINFDGVGSRAVRDFFIHNALYWLHEFHFDGLRLDAVHEIADDSTPHILTELADAVWKSVPPDRNVHLILENDRNQSRYLRRGANSRPLAYTAQWNDDIHHALHTLVTGEGEGYYRDYAELPLDQLGRSLVSGFAYQGEASIHRNGKPRGESTQGLPPTAFISFLQNHDQVGNRAFGERIASLADCHAVRAAVAILMLAPSPPMLFMGEEFGAKTPFLFFCDFKGDLAAAVTAGRRNEFADFAAFKNPAVRETIPDPNAVSTFERSRLDWNSTAQSPHRTWADFYRQLLALRSESIVPLISISISKRGNPTADYQIHDDHGLTVRWSFPDNRELTLAANLGPAPLSNVPIPTAPILYSTDSGALSPGSRQTLRQTLPPWTVSWFLQS
ncbi:MAG TPA: malto-oligosyltrehalose trehalohydrolase [Terriglobales bacterium]|nr:malto-oligosyltrehalose trehalohydrolase [Terriglobales bacterium]